MKTGFHASTSLTDRQLLEQVKHLAASERDATACLIAALAELDARRLFLGEGFPSLFVYCTEALHLSEHAAYNRIEAARAARKWPIILQMIADGAVTLTAVRLLAGSLTDANHRQLLAEATHKSKREVERMIAALRPQPPVPSIVRKLPGPNPDVPRTFTPVRTESPTTALLTPRTEEPTPTPTPAPAPLPPRRAAVISLLAPERYKIQMTVSRETHDKLRRVQDLIRHQVPDADPAELFDRALTLLLHDLERKKVAAAQRPRPVSPRTLVSRHVPAAVKREVWKRDQGQCSFVGAERRCTERGFLEFHHVIPFADGGPTTVDNLQLRCRAHNVYEAEQHFGPLFVREEVPVYSSFRNELGLTGAGGPTATGWTCFAKMLSRCG